MIDEKLINKLVNDAIATAIEKKLDSMITIKVRKILDTDLEDLVSGLVTDLVEETIDTQELVHLTKNEVIGEFDLEAMETRLDECEEALDHIRGC